MTWPNFFILGAAKAGTTSLYHYLSQHPQVGMSRTKETNYFALCNDPLDFRGPGDRDYINRHAVTSAEAYRDQFAHCSGKVAVGEASPLYLYHPDVPDRLREFAPDARLVAILRDPVARAYSAFLHVVRDGREPLDDFGAALDRESERIADNWEHLWHFRAMGLYHEQLRRYYQRFPREQIRVYLYEDLKADPHGVLADIFEFLGVDACPSADPSILHNDARMPAERRPPLDPRVRDQLTDSFREDIAKLETLIGRDLSAWLRCPALIAEG